MSNSPESWRKSGNTVARRFSREDLADQWIDGGAKLAVRPGEAGVWVSRGKVARILAEGQVIAASVTDRLKRIFTGGEDLVLIMEDIEPIGLEFQLGGEGEDGTAGKLLTRDRVPMVFDVRLTLRLVPDGVGGLFTLFKGGPTLETWRIAELVGEELLYRAFGPEVARHDHRELAGDLDLLAHYVAEAKKAVARWLAAHGMELERLAMNPALTGLERSRMLEKEQKARREGERARHESELTRMELEHERLLLREKLATRAQEARAKNDIETGEIIRAALVAEKERELAAVELEEEMARIRTETRMQALQKQKEIEAFAKRHDLDLEKERMEVRARLEMEQMRQLAEEHRLNKEHKAGLRMREMEFRRDAAREEREHVERLMAVGREQGAVTPEVLGEAIRQQGVRKALEEFGLRGEDVPIPHGRPEAGGGLPGEDGVSPGVGVEEEPMLIEDHTDHGSAYEEESEADMVVCPSCGEALPEGMRFCGYCGAVLR
ncbi:MAG: zinc-ribbon domain-containing protein [Desulfatibacillaceae bacterium]